MSERTPERRLWAAYLRAGFNRASFARAIDMAYHTVDAWDRGAATPDLHHFARAAHVVGYTMDELYFGRGGMHARRLEPPTSDQPPPGATVDRPKPPKRRARQTEQ